MFACRNLVRRSRKFLPLPRRADFIRVALLGRQPATVALLAGTRPAVDVLTQFVHVEFTHSTRRHAHRQNFRRERRMRWSFRSARTCQVNNHLRHQTRRPCSMSRISAANQRLENIRSGIADGRAALPMDCSDSPATRADKPPCRTWNYTA